LFSVACFGLYSTALATEVGPYVSITRGIYEKINETAGDCAAKIEVTTSEEALIVARRVLDGSLTSEESHREASH